MAFDDSPYASRSVPYSVIAHGDPAAERILCFGTCQAQDFNAQAGSGEEVIFGQHDDALYYRSYGAIVPRPLLVAEPRITLARGETWELPEAPAGSFVSFWRVVEGARPVKQQTTLETDGISFAEYDAGTWRMNIYPPFPWRSPCELEFIVE